MTIIGVDHICLSADDLPQARAAARKANLACMFDAENLPVHSRKQACLRHPGPDHAAMLFKPASGLPFEVINHGRDAGSGFAGYLPVFAGGDALEADRHAVPPPLAEAAGSALDLPAVAGRFAVGGTPSLFAADGNGDLSIRAVVLPVPDVAGAVEFWTAALGFRGAGGPESGRFKVLKFNAPLPTWCLTLVVTEGGEPGSFHLDDLGWNCISLLADDLDRSQAQVEAHGGTTVSPPYAIEISGRRLILAFSRGPQGELLEFLDRKSVFG